MQSPSDFDFTLPPELIAQRPPRMRQQSRLLIWGRGGRFAHSSFAEVPRLFRPDDLLVLNDTRVFPARLRGRKLPGGGGVEILLVGPTGDPALWECLARPSRRLAPGTEIELEGGLLVQMGARRLDGHRELRFPDSIVVQEYCEHFGHVPLPPYIARGDEALDRERYQTIYGRREGSVAAPTAGLHFDEEIFERLRERGVESLSLTLHVGPGTFEPVGSRELRERKLHPEPYSISADLMDRLRQQRERGGRIIVVGTTTCRALESTPPDAVGEQVARTRLFIQPGFEFVWTDVLITNFHLPRSSLLMLVAAFAGERWREAYDLAVHEGYRFYSYGDVNWIER